ncbi:hypothetical protein HOG48_00330 [Candidatus Peregrinibacteria bacterium]|nr:hypothetical protein [Candidatus Peregrinibacteria bacterium]
MGCEGKVNHGGERRWVLPVLVAIGLAVVTLVGLCSKEDDPVDELEDFIPLDVGPFRHGRSSDRSEIDLHGCSGVIDGVRERVHRSLSDDPVIKDEVRTEAIEAVHEGFSDCIDGDFEVVDDNYVPERFLTLECIEEIEALDEWWGGDWAEDLRQEYEYEQQWIEEYPWVGDGRKYTVICDPDASVKECDVDFSVEGGPFFEFDSIEDAVDAPVWRPSEVNLLIGCRNENSLVGEGDRNYVSKVNIGQTFRPECDEVGCRPIVVPSIAFKLGTSIYSSWGMGGGESLPDELWGDTDSLHDFGLFFVEGGQVPLFLEDGNGDAAQAYWDLMTTVYGVIPVNEVISEFYLP